MAPRPWHAPAADPLTVQLDGPLRSRCSKVAARSVKSAALVLGLNSGRKRFF